MSYTIDVYRKQVTPVRNILDFALYVTYFPQLVAGPIERATHLLPQILRPREITIDKFTFGLRLVLWGLLKKVVVADRLALYVDAVFGNAYYHSSLTFYLAAFFFTWQIYCDFSAYSDIARGIGKMMGFDIVINFQNPFLSTDIREFWRRWHISLSQWFRDYLYIPLGGDRKGNIRTYLNLLIVTTLCGLWHGADLTFLVWGSIHGLYLCITHFVQERPSKTPHTSSLRLRLPRFIRILFTYHLVLFAFIFFRANSLSQAFYIIKSIFSPHVYIFANMYILDILLFGFLGILLVFLMEYAWRNEHEGNVLIFRSTTLQTVVCYILVFMIILLGVYRGEQFIYFQF
jgi:D-alanyl-lipoteichoic acid acyltransferase DltB (MBOAT superfamily)